MSKKGSREEKRDSDSLDLRLKHGLLRNGLLKTRGVVYHVYSVIGMYADFKTGVSSPTFETIKKDTGITNNKTITEAVKELEEIGALKCVKRHRINKKGKEVGNLRNYYILAHPGADEKYKE